MYYLQNGVLDGNLLPKDGHLILAIQQPFPIGQPKGQIVVILTLAIVCRLGDVNVGSAGRNPKHFVVA
jgi:hypothetical protein